MEKGQMRGFYGGKVGTEGRGKMSEVGDKGQ